jgi:hypothetical protein
MCRKEGDATGDGVRDGGLLVSEEKRMKEMLKSYIIIMK